MSTRVWCYFLLFWSILPLAQERRIYQSKYCTPVCASLLFSSQILTKSLRKILHSFTEKILKKSLRKNAEKPQIHSKQGENPLFTKKNRNSTLWYSVTFFPKTKPLDENSLLSWCFQFMTLLWLIGLFYFIFIYLPWGSIMKKRRGTTPLH